MKKQFPISNKSLNILIVKLSADGQSQLIRFLDRTDPETASRFRDWLIKAPDTQVCAVADLLNRDTDGREFTAWWQSVERPYSKPRVRSATGSPTFGLKSFKGGGWLSFFCIIHIYIAPIITLVSFTVALLKVIPVGNRFPSLVVLAVGSGIANICLTIFGMYAGIKLHRVEAGAVRFARRYLISCLAWAFLMIFLSNIPSDISDYAQDSMFYSSLGGFVKVLFSSTIWYSYFFMSKRIKAMFPDELEIILPERTQSKVEQVSDSAYEKIQIKY